jgi:fatty-acyl-CoA synthase
MLGPYAAMIAEVRSRCPDLERVLLFGTDAWDSLLEAGRGADRPDRPPGGRHRDDVPRPQKR